MPGAIAIPVPDVGILEQAEALFEPSARVARIRAQVMATPASICLERPSLMREFRRSGQGRAAARRHALLGRASALAHVYRSRRPRIYDDELIVGNMSSKRVAANFYAEGGSIGVLEDIWDLEDRPVPLVMSRKEKLRMLGLTVDAARYNVGLRALARPGRLSHFFHLFRPRRYIVTEEAGVSHQIVDYAMVVREGLRAPEQLAQRCLSSGSLPDGTPLGPDEVAFFESVQVTVAGIREMARNLSREAARLAQLPETRPERAAELRRVAEACARVPYHPARSFQEGLQSVWIVHVCMNLEDYEQGLSFGRLDRILDPLYRADLEADRLSPEQAAELIACFYLKTCETMPAYSERFDLAFSGNTVGQAITVGGTDEAGEDTTNELSGLFLSAFAQVRTREPNIQVRVHADTPQWFLDLGARVVQLGCGSPAFFGDAAIVRALEGVGMSNAHARDYGVIGCVELTSPGRTYSSSDAALFNLPLCLELALNEGRDFRGRRIGPATPPVARMQGFDDLLAAFRAQVGHAVDEMVEVISWLEQTYRQLRTTPLNSMLTQGCLERGRDVTWGGALYDMTAIQAVGLATTGDSLLAVRRLCFEQRRLDLEQLVQVLRSDFEGHATLRAELVARLPRYGNGDAEADATTQLAADAFSDAICAKRNTRGGRYIPGFYTMTCGTAFGKVTGASADGRRAGHRLSNGFSPVDGADKEGPTALLRSAGGLDKRRWANGGALNLKFDQRTVQGVVGRRALAALLRTYLVDEGGLEVQVNVLDAETLRAAKADPSAFPNLLVRVSGYCAYFNDLQPSVQDEIIERAAHGLN